MKEPEKSAYQLDFANERTTRAYGTLNKKIADHSTREQQKMKYFSIIYDETNVDSLTREKS